MDPTVAVSVAVIVGTPILSSMGVSFSPVQHIATRFVLLLALLYAVQKGPMPGLLAFLAVFSLLMERNHEVLTKFPHQDPSSFALAGTGGRLGLRPTSIFAKTESKALEPDHQVASYHTPAKHEDADASDLYDNIPHLDAGPNSTEAPSFYITKGLTS
jgi:hypothetical protein